ncbi:MAG: phage major capsid protein [Desulfobaccales bacterium]
MKKPKIQVKRSSYMGLSIQELRQARHAKVKELRALTDGHPGAWTASLEEKYRGLMSEVDNFDDEINRYQTILDLECGTLSRQRGALGFNARGQTPEEAKAHLEAFYNFVRTGDESGLRRFRVVDAYTTEDKGGFLIPAQLDDPIDTIAFKQGAMADVCDGRSVDTYEYQRVIGVGGTGAGWVTEKQPRPATTTTDIRLLRPAWGTVYAYPMLSQDLLDSGITDIEAFLIEQVGLEIGQLMGSAFISGTGVSQPLGILSYPFTTDADGTRPFGTFKYIPSTPIADVDILFDSLITAVYSLKRAYKQGSVWLMNSVTAGVVRLLKDSVGRYLWQENNQEDLPPLLCGHPVYIDEFLPDVTTGNIPILFGNFKRGFMITRLATVVMLRDPYSNKPYVGFYFLRRVGTMLKNSECIRGIKIASS